MYSKIQLFYLQTFYLYKGINIYDMGPLKGIKIIEMTGIGPGPFAGMLLADMGAEVIQVERASADYVIPDCNRRGKKSIVLDLKKDSEVVKLLKLIRQADVIFEGFRPGVMERLGIGPEICLEQNPKLIYGRMTGWGQSGPLSTAAGHDINYIAITGALYATGRKDSPPAPPLNLIGDYGGGAMFLVTGILAALLETQRSGLGQVIDVAMTEGTANLMSIFNTLDGIGQWNVNRASNLLDSGAHFYDCYETQDGLYISIGAIESKFYNLLIELAELDPALFSAQLSVKKWPELKSILKSVFLTKTRQEWCDIMEGTDVCFAPVLNYREAQSYAHNVARGSYINLDGIIQPAPAPKFSRTPSEVQHGSRQAGYDTTSILADWGVDD